MALAAVALGVLSIAGCGGSNDRRLANTVSDTNAPGAAGGDPASTPSTPPPPPPKKVSEECAALNTFQLLNYSIGLVDAQKEKDKKDEAVRALEASAAAAAGKAPELQSSLKMIVLKHKARFEGGGEPTPSAGDPTVKEAGEKLGAWAKDHDC
jgi:hypothetical protein